MADASPSDPNTPSVHNHSKGRPHSHSHFGAHMHDGGSLTIRRAIAVTLVFMMIEFVGGWVANSLALISDAAHMLTDIGAMLLSLFALWVSRRPKTETMSFGYHRAEILGALTSGLMIWLISGFLIYEAIVRMQEPPEVNAPILIVVATFGLLANLTSMWILRDTRHLNLNVKAAYVHLLSDCLGSVGAVLAGTVLLFTGWRAIDPIITLIFSGLMLASSWNLVKEAVQILMESTPSHLDPRQIRKDLESLAGVIECHDLHIWSVTSGRQALSAHLVSKDPSQEVLSEAHLMLKNKHQIEHTTIQIEHPSRFQSERCYDCAPKREHH